MMIYELFTSFKPTAYFALIFNELSFVLIIIIIHTEITQICVHCYYWLVESGSHSIRIGVGEVNRDYCMYAFDSFVIIDRYQYEKKKLTQSTERIYTL